MTIYLDTHVTVYLSWGPLWSEHTENLTSTVHLAMTKCQLKLEDKFCPAHLQIASYLRSRLVGHRKHSNLMGPDMSWLLQKEKDWFLQHLSWNYSSSRRPLFWDISDISDYLQMCRLSICPYRFSTTALHFVQPLERLEAKDPAACGAALAAMPAPAGLPNPVVETCLVSPKILQTTCDINVDPCWLTFLLVLRCNSKKNDICCFGIEADKSCAQTWQPPGSQCEAKALRSWETVQIAGESHLVSAQYGGVQSRGVPPVIIHF